MQYLKMWIFFQTLTENFFWWKIEFPPKKKAPAVVTFLVKLTHFWLMMLQFWLRLSKHPKQCFYLQTQRISQKIHIQSVWKATLVYFLFVHHCIRIKNKIEKKNTTSDFISWNALSALRLYRITPRKTLSLFIIADQKLIPRWLFLAWKLISRKLVPGPAVFYLICQKFHVCPKHFPFVFVRM